MTALHISAPKGWNELTQDQLVFLFRSVARVNRVNAARRFNSEDDYSAQTTAQVAVLCLLRWNGLAVVCPYADGWLVARNKQEFVVSGRDLAAASRSLDWIGTLPQEPVRLERIGNARAVEADLSDEFSFDDWLSCEALWQNYQVSQSPECLNRMAAFLYHDEALKLEEHQQLSIFYWWSGVKSLCNRLYPNFFQPAAGPGLEPSPELIRRNMDSQIRALTKGDITKEETILAMPVHRALTELDALAREFDELNRKYPSK